MFPQLSVATIVSVISSHSIPSNVHVACPVGPTRIAPLLSITGVASSVPWLTVIETSSRHLSRTSQLNVVDVAQTSGSIMSSSMSGAMLSTMYVRMYSTFLPHTSTPVNFTTSSSQSIFGSFRTTYGYSQFVSLFHIHSSQPFTLPQGVSFESKQPLDTVSFISSIHAVAPYQIHTSSISHMRFSPSICISSSISSGIGDVISKVTSGFAVLTGTVVFSTVPLPHSSTPKISIVSSPHVTVPSQVTVAVPVEIPSFHGDRIVNVASVVKSNMVAPILVTVAS